MKLLPAWDEVVRVCPSQIQEIKSPFHDVELKQLWINALLIDSSYKEIKKTIQSTATQWGPSIKIRGVELS